MRAKLFCLGPVVALLGLLNLTSVAYSADEPWRLGEALGLDDGFSLTGVQRTRFENLVDNVQPGTSANDQGLIFRTLLDARYQNDGFSAQVEFQDARQEWMDDDSVVSTATVNALEILQANIGLAFDNDNGLLRAGRLTTDWGSRRFLARNRFRNTINAFDGLEIDHRNSSGNRLRVLLSQVVNRQPSDRPGLLNNDYETDRSHNAQQFHGLSYSLPQLSAHFETELFAFSLLEKDSSKLATSNRRIHSLGFRLRAAPAPGELDFEVETLMQSGERRASSAGSDVVNLDHGAWFQYLALGYSFEIPSRLRIVLEFDYASGDEDPFDLDDQRFDSLFGVSTFEFGVVGLYNPFSRSNLVTPGVRLTANPRPDLNLMLSYRHFWLAEQRDSWGRTGLRDVSGNTDSYLGQHLEARLRWDVIPGNLQIDTGAIFLNAENFSNANSRYGYIGTVFTF